MDSQEMTILHRKIEQGVKFAVAQALERHRKLGESIAIWRDGKVVTLSADQIPAMDDAQVRNEQQETQWPNCLPGPNSSAYDNK